MNDFVLRGFCRTCKWPIYLWNMGNTYFPRYTEYVDENMNTHMNPFEIHKIEPVWFLSAKQMRIVRSSKEFYEEYNTWKKRKSPDGTIATMLEKNPFLVSKILKEAGEKSKEVKK